MKHGVNAAEGSRDVDLPDWLSTLCGGLDKQIEHHLFPRLPPNRLREVAKNAGVDAYMLDRAEQLQEAWLAGKERIGITAGASAPEVLVQEVISRLRQIASGQSGREVVVEELSGVVESVVFPLPKN